MLSSTSQSHQQRNQNLHLRHFNWPHVPIFHSFTINVQLSLKWPQAVLFKVLTCLLRQRKSLQTLPPKPPSASRDYFILWTLTCCFELVKTLSFDDKNQDHVTWNVSYRWLWSPHGPRLEAELRGHCRAAVHQPHPWWTPETHGSQNKASWEETRHIRCLGNCACSAGTQALRTELGIGTLGEKKRNCEPKWHELVNVECWGCFFFFSQFVIPWQFEALVGSKNTRALCKLKTLFFSPLLSGTIAVSNFSICPLFHSSCFLLSDSFPLWLSVSLPLSVCYADADLLISRKTTGRITTWLGNSFLCVFHTLRAHLPSASCQLSAPLFNKFPASGPRREESSFFLFIYLFSTSLPSHFMLCESTNWTYLLVSLA